MDMALILVLEDVTVRLMLEVQVRLELMMLDQQPPHILTHPVRKQQPLQHVELPPMEEQQFLYKTTSGKAV